jgi:hypothetical protein
MRKDVNPLTCFVCANRKLSLKPSLSNSLQQAANRASVRCEGLLPFAIHTQTWSSPRVEGPVLYWDDPRDPNALR